MMFYFVSGGLSTEGWPSPLAGGQTAGLRVPAVPLRRAAGASPEAGKAIALLPEINGSCQS